VVNSSRQVECDERAPQVVSLEHRVDGRLGVRLSPGEVAASVGGAGRPHVRRAGTHLVEYAVAEGQHGKTVYVRENAIVPSLDEWIGSLFADEHLDNTCEALAAVSDLEPDGDEYRQLDLRRQLKECDAKLARYRALLEQDGDITVVANLDCRGRA
jgi:hypothetical protein